MKRLLACATAAMLIVALGSAATVAAPRSSTLTCFGNCTLSGTTATIWTNGTSGDSGGVYYTKYSGKSFYGQQVSQITVLSNTVTGSALGIDPRWSIPIDTNNDGLTDLFAFVAFGTCNNGAGLVDVINDTTCTISYGSNSYPNWAAYVAANPTDRISYDVNYAFVIADGSGGVAGTWTISNLKVGSTK